MILTSSSRQKSIQVLLNFNDNIAVDLLPRIFFVDKYFQIDIGNDSELQL